MTIRFQCPNCDARIGATPEMNSERVECPRCTAMLFVPDPSDADDSYIEGDFLATEEAPVRFGNDKEKVEVEMDMTPMVDVTFLLLIFFMVTAAFSMQKSFEIPTPKEDRPSTEVVTLEDFEDDPEYVVVRIDENSTFHISTAYWDEEREAPSAQDLRVALAEARRGDGNTVPTRLLVIAHGEAWHETVVMAMDVGTAVGIEELKLVTVEDDPA